MIEPVNSKSQLLSALESKLREPPFELRQAATVQEFRIASGDVRYLLEPKIRVAGHHDLRADMLVYDPVLGSLGLVEVADGTSTPGPWIESAVDRATYLRHLLLRELDASGGPSAPRALAVELVLVWASASASSGPLESSISDTLTKVARETAYLHSIGVNVLRHSPGPQGFLPQDLRRAFSWLLCWTKRWYGRQADPPTQSAQPSPGLASIRLENYRLRGRRILQLEPSARTHIVHGQNGSGKSSLVEALELISTGSVERIGKIADPSARQASYEAVIRNGDSTDKACVTLGFRGAADREYRIGRTDSPPSPLDEKMAAVSFRLDEEVMDRLSRGSDAERARLFLDGFFPEESPKLKTFDEKRVGFQQAWDGLTAPLRKVLEDLCRTQRPDLPVGEALARTFSEALGFLDVRQKRLTPGQMEVFVGVDLAVVRGLAPLSPELEKLLVAWPEHFPTPAQLPEALRQLDEIVEGMASAIGALRSHLDNAERLLTEFGGWVAEGKRCTRGRVDLLNACLESSALADLARKQRDVCATLVRANSLGWKTSRVEGASAWLDRVPADSDILQALEAAVVRLDAERQELQQQLLSTEQAMTADGLPREASDRRYHLSHAELASLDQVGGVLLRAGAGSGAEPPRLGHQLDAALRQDEPMSVANIVLGRSGWATELKARLEPLAQAIRAFPKRAGAGLRATARYETITGLRHLAREWCSAGDALSRTFLARIGASPAEAVDGPSDPLNPAINEVMALFTPARWMYQDIRISHQQQNDGGHDVSLLIADDTSGNTKASLRLNTAELNTFTLALFLVCVPKLRNPLNVLVLDDPLENMDELTVTTLARGLARLNRLRSAPRDLLIFLHSEDDVARFLHELPAALYRLPWLAAEGTQETTVRADRLESTVTDQLQTLDGLVEDTPRGN